MNLFKKIDNYLLHNFPNIWVTKVHIFLPIAIIFMLIIYVFNVILIGYNIKDELPQAEWGVTLMVIPVLIFIVYWFVIQARYNVEKSGGKLSIPLEYMNFFLYFLMFVVSYLLISFIPYTNDLKIERIANKTEIKKDIKNLNLGNTITNNSETIRQEGNRYKIGYQNYINTYYWQIEEIENEVSDAVTVVREDFDKSYEERGYYEEKLMNYEDYLKNPIPRNTTNLFILATRNQVDEIISDYVYSFNKYTNNEISATVKQVWDNGLKIEKQEIENNQEYSYNYSYWRNTVNYKLENIARLKIRNNGAFQANYGGSEISKIILSWLLMMSLMVWIFKQIHWRDYLFGLLALALTPVLAGIIGVFFGVFVRADEEFLFTLVFMAYALAIIFTIKGFVSNYKSRFSIVSTMYLHVWLPILPLFYYIFMYEVYYRHNYEERIEFQTETLFYASLIIGLLSIGLFKMIYKKMRLLPNHK